MWLMLMGSALGADIVFCGNSYTQGNDLPGRVQDAIRALPGCETETKGLTSGGLTLANHLDRVNSNTGEWGARLGPDADPFSILILQDQSQIPGFPQSQPEWVDSHAAAGMLADMGRTHGADTIFFLTWGYPDGDSNNELLYPDYWTMQGLLQGGYEAYALQANTPYIAPVGPTFGDIWLLDEAAGRDPIADGSTFIGLFSGDRKHPSAAGSSLAASVFGHFITGRPLTGTEGMGGIDSTLASTFHDVARSRVLDLPPVGEVGEPRWFEEDPIDDVVLLSGACTYPRWRVTTAEARTSINVGSTEQGGWLVVDADLDVDSLVVMGEGQLTVRAGELTAEELIADRIDWLGGSLNIYAGTVTETTEVIGPMTIRKSWDGTVSGGEVTVFGGASIGAVDGGVMTLNGPQVVIEGESTITELIAPSGLAGAGMLVSATALTVETLSGGGDCELTETAAGIAYDCDAEPVTDDTTDEGNTDTSEVEPGGCGCTSAASPLTSVGGLLCLLVWRRRRQ